MNRERSAHKIQPIKLSLLCLLQFGYRRKTNRRAHKTPTFNFTICRALTFNRFSFVFFVSASSSSLVRLIFFFFVSSMFHSLTLFDGGRNAPALARLSLASFTWIRSIDEIFIFFRFVVIWREQFVNWVNSIIHPNSPIENSTSHCTLNMCVCARASQSRREFETAIANLGF